MKKIPFTRFAVFARCVLCVPVLAAFAPCSDEGKSTVRMTDTDSAAVAAAAATGTLVANDGNVRAVDYMLTSDRYRNWTRAQRDLDALPVTTTSNRLRVSNASDTDVERLVRQLESDPAARRAIEPSGLSVRDYVLTTLALAQAMDATENGTRTRLTGVPRENLDIYTTNRDDVRRLRRDSRYRVVDDDSDGDSDKKSDGDSDRRSGKKHKNKRGGDSDSR